MDANKLLILQDTKYKIRECCALCEHGQFTALAEFGTCTVKTYGHLKHTGPARNLSVYRYGCCGDGSWKLDNGELGRMGAYAEFLPDSSRR